jgi:uncharacterized protein YndB with AHSA1/START domain
MESALNTSRPLRLQVRRTFQAPPARLFEAWTTPEELKRWHAPAPLTCTLAEVDLRVGGKYRIHMREPDGKEHQVYGVFRVIEPPTRLVYTWRWERVAPTSDTTDTQITVEFLPRGTGTEVVLTHEGFATAQDRDNHEKGWTGVLDKAITVLGG